jgi:D-alanyl-D-alanine carboxypeptidase
VARRRINLATLLITTVSLVLGCRPPAAETSGVGHALQALVDRAVADHELVHAAALHVDSPAFGLVWEGAAGAADPDTGSVMTAATPVRIASNTKTFIAATILRLAEEGRLGLDDPITAHLPENQVGLLRADGYDPEKMTVRHLLTHTSGLYDHSQGDRYGEEILADPNHRWTRDEQLTAAVEWGEPQASPGEVYTYCDTGYILLGEIVEQVAGRPMAAAVREIIGFDRLGMNSTWWETLEPAPRGTPERAHQYFGEVDTTGFDPSFDLYGGGGLVSTVGDLARFYRALFNGGVFAGPDAAASMLTTIDGVRALPDAGETDLPPGAYRMGVWVVEVEGLSTYRHTGFWGTLATYVPELDLTVTATVNQNQGRAALEGMVREAIVIMRSQHVVGDPVRGLLDRAVGDVDGVDRGDTRVDTVCVIDLGEDV